MFKDISKSEKRAIRRDIINYVIHLIHEGGHFQHTTIFYVKRYVRYEELNQYGMTMRAYGNASWHK